MANNGYKQRQFRCWATWLVGIMATLSLVILAWKGIASVIDVVMYASLLYLLTTPHPIERHVSH